MIPTGKEWLQELKAGDKVIIQNTGFQTRNEVVTVGRTTNTQIIIYRKQTYQKFRKNDGYEIGGDKWHCPQLKPYTDDAAQEIRLATARIILHQTKWNEVPDEKILQIMAILKAQENTPK